MHSLLRELHERAHADIAPHLFDALEFMGTRSPYKGGLRLLELLDFIEREAKAVEDEFTAEGVRDAIAYATGRLLDDDLNEKYNLYDNSGQDRMRLLESVTSGMGALAAREIDAYLRGHPGASATNIKAYFEANGERAIRFTKAQRAGHYGAFRIGTDSMAWVTDVVANRTEFLLDRDSLADGDERVQALLAQENAEHLVMAAQVRLRLAQLDKIERIVTSPFSKERHLHRELGGSPWIFGGAYVDTSGVRRLTTGNEVDIALVRPDGVLHVVELKQANLHTVKSHRSEPVPTAEVHDAVMQVANYLRDFDENRSRILAAHGLDVRRASGTVVIGHPKFDTSFSEQQVNETLRSYASHLGRIDVITYKQLVDSARRSLQPPR
ncbi:MAG: Shedu anti-phage system protein SduA domain-containing protein [Umezawaea sp.]